MKKFLLLFLLSIVSGCPSTTTSEGSKSRQIEDSSLSSQPSQPILTRTYWPLDYIVQRHNTIVHELSHYRVTVTTNCLNDSSVINLVTADVGTALDVSHNYESLLSVERGTVVWKQGRLTKQIFQHDSLAQKLGPLATLVLSHTSFTRYRAPNFYFTTRLGVPDSDIFIEAEVALMPNSKLRLVKVRKQVETK
jgi:hypothetical protein